MVVSLSARCRSVEKRFYKNGPVPHTWVTTNYLQKSVPRTWVTIADQQRQNPLGSSSPVRKSTANNRRKLLEGSRSLNPKIYSKLCGVKKATNPIHITTSYHKARSNVLTSGTISRSKKKLGPYEGLYKCTGLSPKEKMYVIGTCEAKSDRYAQLKQMAADAIQNNKIFTIYGSCKAVRKGLVERGWVEKLPVRRMNINKIRSGKLANQEIRTELERLLLSHLLEKSSPNFIWRTKEYQTEDIDMSTDYNVPTVNKLQTGAVWTTKQGLCSTMKRNYWFYIENIAEVYSPRTYNTNDPSEIDSFHNDFKITTCTSLLKWVLSMVANDRPVFLPNGTVSINIITFALKRCAEYLYRKQNSDIDKPVSHVSPGQWESFKKHYYRIISKTDYFKQDEENKLGLYLSYAKLVLKEIHKYRPQLSCEGCHNIWIVKPAHYCRGRGIKMASMLGDLNDILNKARTKYVVQKYIEEPLLIHETKFDIRQYYLITSTYPLVIWMYQDCYLKFSSQKYNLKNYHESIHLTNNAVQRKYKNCHNRHTELPLSNMWDLEKYESYLKSIGKEDVWDSIVYPGMKKSIISIMLGCQDFLVACKNRFELYGCDFLMDKDYKPWLIEINSCPDLTSTTPVTAKICPAVIMDILKVVIDYANDPDSPTGKFECIYRQPFTTPRYSSVGGDLSVRGFSLPSTYFYKGKVPLKDSFQELTKHLDIAAIMEYMKQIYDDTITWSKSDCHYESANNVELELNGQCSQPKRQSPSGFIRERAFNIVNRLTDKVVTDATVSIEKEYSNSRITSTTNNGTLTSFEYTNKEEMDLSALGALTVENWEDLGRLETTLLKLLTFYYKKI